MNLPGAKVTGGDIISHVVAILHDKYPIQEDEYETDDEVNKVEVKQTQVGKIAIRLKGTYWGHIE